MSSTEQCQVPVVYSPKYLAAAAIPFKPPRISIPPVHFSSDKCFDIQPHLGASTHHEAYERLVTFARIYSALRTRLGGRLHSKSNIRSRPDYIASENALSVYSSKYPLVCTYFGQPL